VGTAVDVVLVGVGVTLILSTLISAVRATILPRGVQNRLSRLAIAIVRSGCRLLVAPSSSYEQRDRVMAMLGPLSLLTLLVTWLILILTGYALIYRAVSVHTVVRAIELSGSSIFTLGTTTATHLVGDLISYTEAGMGLLVVTLLITYLPSIYGAFARRENGVALLRVRAGTPPRAVTMLIRYYRIDGAEARLGQFWQTWESWFVDVEESHSTFPVLVVFRSPRPEQSWVVAAGVVLDAASLWLAAVEHPKDPDAALCIRAGFQTLQLLAASSHVPFDADPLPTDPISVSREEFDAALDEMAEAGMRLKPDREQAWQDWAGWRVNYDTALLNLARLVEAPPAPWVSDRSPMPRRSTTVRSSLAAIRARRPT
jgi:hypothetical protein